MPTKKRKVPLHVMVLKECLQDKAFLRQFFSRNVERELLDLCDLDSIQFVPVSFVNGKMAVFYSDLLYSINTVSGAGYLHLFIQFAYSKELQHPNFRIIKSTMDVMQYHLDNGNRQLPIVIPIICHATCHDVPVPARNWFTCFECPSLAETVMKQHMPVIDCSVDKSMIRSAKPHHKHLSALCSHFNYQDVSKTESIVNKILKLYNKKVA